MLLISYFTEKAYIYANKKRPLVESVSNVCLWQPLVDDLRASQVDGELRSNFSMPADVRILLNASWAS